jgi:ATP-dependent Lhr-like helicase
MLVPANRFEVLECRAAVDGELSRRAGHAAPEGDPARSTCSPSTSSAWPAPSAFDADELYAEITIGLALPRARPRETFDRVVDFVATGGYALQEPTSAIAKIRRGRDGLWRITHPRVAQQYRLNVGTIIEAPLLTVRWRAPRRARRAGRACSAGSRRASSRR